MPAFATCDRCGVSQPARTHFSSVSFTNFLPGYPVYVTGQCECGGTLAIRADPDGKVLFDGAGNRIPFRRAVKAIAGRSDAELERLGSALRQAESLTSRGRVADARATVAVAAPWISELFPADQDGTKAFREWVLVLVTVVTLVLNLRQRLGQAVEPDDIAQIQEQAVEMYKRGLREGQRGPGPAHEFRSYGDSQVGQSADHGRPRISMRHQAAGGAIGRGIVLAPEMVRDILAKNGRIIAVGIRTGIPYHHLARASRTGAGGEVAAALASLP